MYKIAVCEDEERDLEIVKQLLELYGARHEWKYALKTYDTAKNFIRDMERMKSIPDIVFLDIYLREGNGVEVAKEMRANGFANPIVFLTASREYALEAYNVDAAQYLVKPLEQKRFFSILDRLFLKTEEEREQWMVLRIGGEFRRIPLDKVVYCEAQRNYQHLCMEDGSKYKVRMTMIELFSYLEKRSEFVQVASAYIFNLSFIESMNSKTVTIGTGKTIHLPRGSYSSLKEEYFQYYCGE